jgi:SagB-type dehydrogenase family enzyme
MFGYVSGAALSDSQSSFVIEPWELAYAYHQATKHHYNRYARSLGYLDWATQPDPFLRFSVATLLPLPLTPDRAEPSYDALFEPVAVAVQPIDLETISAFFEYSLALSAWKEYNGSRWALRINPSSGNLHPTEGYLVIGPVKGLHDEPGVYHYAPKEHALERRTVLSCNLWQRLMDGFPPGTFLAGLTSIHWREAWKYGERAYRYCQHDVGHALAALALSAAVQGWRVQPLSAMGDAETAALLGLERSSDSIPAEREYADLLVAVMPEARTASFRSAGIGAVPGEVIAEIAADAWVGQATRLSTEHVTWELIDAVADACAKPAVEVPTAAILTGRTAQDDQPECSSTFGVPFRAKRPDVSARKIIRQRRSAVDFDGKTGLTLDQFYLMLDRTLPRGDRVPWSTLGPPVCVDLGLLVHLVDGIDPGLYILVRSPDRLVRMREAMNPTFHWQKPSGCPESLPLFLLKIGDMRGVAGQVSCGQDIAADGAFSLGMIAEFEEPLRAYGAWFYRRLFWETGMVGQVLYLEAEAAGVRATGIGCFFDDPVHDLFGLKGTRFQSLYHFTVGGPVEDTRLTTLPPYSRE